jgi:aspartate/methionine/tyrosine aminotransferase
MTQRILIVINPSNPTGSAINEERIKEIAAFVKSINWF